MTHAQIPDFSLPMPSTAARLDPADPILAAIDAHAEAWSAFQVAPEGRETRLAEAAMDAALEALLATPCGSRFGALALVRHLRWLIAEEAVTGDPDDIVGRLVLMREADLSRFVGSDLPPIAIPRAAPSGRLAAPVSTRALPALDLRHRCDAAALPDEPLPGEIEPWEAVAPIRPDTAFVRGRRLIDAAGELLTACILIGAGAYLTGLASLH